MKKFLLLFISILTFSFLFTTNKTYAQEYPQGETWFLNGNINQEPVEFEISFISNNKVCDHLGAFSIVGKFQVIYQSNDETILVYNNFAWTNDVYRIITFKEAPTGELLTWLEANGVKLTGGGVGYDEGYQYGYQDGFIAGEKSKLAKNNESFYNNIAIWIPAVITVVALASIISIFGIKKKEWIIK